MTKLTKQGVRDLNHLKGPKGKKLDMPPSHQMCKHPERIRHFSGDTQCKDCGVMWDWNGNPY